MNLFEHQVVTKDKHVITVFILLELLIFSTGCSFDYLAKTKKEFHKKLSEPDKGVQGIVTLHVQQNFERSENIIL